MWFFQDNILPNQQVLLFFFITDEISLLQDEMASQARFGLRAIVWRPLHKSDNNVSSGLTATSYEKCEPGETELNPEVTDWTSEFYCGYFWVRKFSRTRVVECNWYVLMSNISYKYAKVISHVQFFQFSVSDKWLCNFQALFCVASWLSSMSFH